MKVFPDFNKELTLEERIGIYIWQLARNLLSAKRRLRIFINIKQLPNDYIEHCRAEELEAHNRYYSAKEYFKDIIKK